jgi:branched-subunit amino acid transport protein
MTVGWGGIVIASVGCYALKLAGVSLPESVLEHPRVKEAAGRLPIAMLAGLVVVELFDSDGRLAFDWHTLAGVGAAALLLSRRCGFLVVFLGAIAVTAATRALF